MKTESDRRVPHVEVGTFGRNKFCLGLSALANFQHPPEKWEKTVFGPLSSAFIPQPGEDKIVYPVPMQVTRDRKIPDEIAEKLYGMHSRLGNADWSKAIQAVGELFPVKDPVRHFVQRALDFRASHDQANVLYREGKMAFVDYLPHLEACLQGAVILKDLKVHHIHFKLMRELAALFGQAVSPEKKRRVFNCNALAVLNNLDQNGSMIWNSGRENQYYGDVQCSMILCLGAAGAMSEKPALKAINPMLIMLLRMSDLLDLDCMQPGALIDSSVNKSVHDMPGIRRTGISCRISSVGLGKQRKFSNPRFNFELSADALAGKEEPNFFVRDK